MKKIFYIFSLLFLFCFVPGVYANEYYIKNYSVDIDVNLNNSLTITETIDVYFNVSKHGIIRSIPTKGKIVRLDGSEKKYIAKIKDIEISESYSKEKENNYLYFKIGDANKTLIEDKTYIIKYNYILGDDLNKEFDELYFNLIGTDWDTFIEGVNFTIKMPKEFDHSMVGFSKGYYGSTNTEGIDYTIADNLIKGSSTRLEKNEALTVRIELPEGYYNEVKLLDMYYFSDYAFFVLGAFFILYSVLLWKKYGRDETLVETVEFYPPGGLNSLEVAYFHNAKSIPKDVVSLLIYLAEKGYLKIKEEKKDTLLIKLKDYEGDKQVEKVFMKGIFENSKNNEVYLSKLKSNFYTTISTILSIQNSHKNHNLIYTKESQSSRFKIIIMSIFSFMFLFLPLVIEYESLDGLSLLGEGTKFDYMFIFYLIVVIVLIILFVITKKRTDYANDLLGKIKGFKTFLNDAEKDKLEALVLDEPTYFYKILPFTYVLGISKKWIKKFEGLITTPPDWYETNDVFTFLVLNQSLNDMMRQAERNLTFRPENNTLGGGFSGGGFSGGGFSGGGSGGGGGSSW